AEVAEQGLAPAVDGFADAEQRRQLGALDALDLVRALGAVDHAPALADVAQAVEQDGIGRQAVAPGAAGLLHVGLDARRQVQVGDETDVWLVDAHAEGDGGDQHQPLLLEEGVLVGLAYRGRHAGVIGQGAQTLAGQPFRRLLDLAAAQAVDDAAVARVLALQEAEQLAARVVLDLYGVADRKSTR